MLCFFCRHQRRRRLPYSPSLQSVQGRTPACGNRSFPHQKGGCGGHPYSLAYFPLCFVVVRRSLGHALNVRSLLRACHASPTEKYTALTHNARTRATDSSHISHRLPGGVSRRRCPSHTTVFCGVAAITQRRSRYPSTGEDDGKKNTPTPHQSLIDFPRRIVVFP